MELATLSHHDPNCTGCPTCSELAAAILQNPTNPILITGMGNSQLRALAERALRSGVPTVRDDEVPDAYAPGLATLRAAQPEARTARPDDEAQLHSMANFRARVYEVATSGRDSANTPATSRTHLEPPNPYSDAALRAWREQ
jgi:hypothetical protein